MSRVHKRHTGAGKADWDAIAARAAKASAWNVAAVRVATRSHDEPRHGLMHKHEERTKLSAGVGKPLHGDKRTSKSRADYKPASHEYALIVGLNIPANSYHNIITSA